MASLVYDAGVDAMAEGTIDFATDAFKVMLVSGYTPNKATDAVFGDVTGEVLGSAGYTAGGAAVTVGVNTAPTSRTDVDLGGATWPTSTISATGAVYYETASGTLVCFVDFGGTVSSLSGTFSLSASTIQINNP